MQFLALLLAVGCADLVIAHGHIQSLTVRGKTYQGYTQMDGKTQKGEIVGWAESKGDSGWLSPQDSTGPDGICHKNAVNAKYSVSVNAGDTINVEWNTWGCGDIRHWGPIVTYLAACDNGDCSTVDKEKLEFFKIAERGLVKGDSYWAQDELCVANATDGKGKMWDVVIPAGLKKGAYVMRHEPISIQDNSGVAQLYPQCVNLEVGGDGTVLPEGILGEKLYDPNSPSFLSGPNYPKGSKTYKIPGPPLADFSGSGSNAPAEASGTSSEASASLTAQRSSVATAVPISSPSSAPTVQSASVSGSSETASGTNTSNGATSTDKAVHSGGRCHSKHRRPTPSA